MTKLKNNISTDYLKRAKKHMPLGVADSYRYWGEEDTVCVDHMENCRFTDVDGNEFIDFRLAYGPIILGYRDERIDSAVVDTIQNQGSMVGFSTSTESDVAELIKEMCPQIEKLRFANSGTEAVLELSEQRVVSQAKIWSLWLRVVSTVYMTR